MDIVYRKRREYLLLVSYRNLVSVDRKGLVWFFLVGKTSLLGRGDVDDPLE